MGRSARFRRSPRTDVLEFARPFPMQGAIVTYRRGRKWFDRVRQDSIVSCVGVHGTSGRVRARVVHVFMVPAAAIGGEEGERIRLVYPNVREDEEFTRLELEVIGP
jgi:hypothetical protein